MNYSPGQVRALIDEYAALKAKADTSPAGMSALIQLADINLQFAMLPEGLWAVLLLHGLLGFDQRTTAELLRIPQTRVSRRYADALDEVTYYINGGT